MRTSTQLKALIRNLSEEKKVETEVLLRNFMMERLLERIAASKYNRYFILKGGMLITSMFGIDMRATMDMDMTVNGTNISSAELETIFKDILRIQVDDGAVLSFLNIEEIREDAEYPGYRISIGALLDRTRQTLKIDITTGDPITPREIEHAYKLMFEDRTVNIMSYNAETVLAEKFETIVARGVTNTRMRDFYDIHIISSINNFNPRIFKNALEKTAEKRRTVELLSDGVSGSILQIKENEILADHWRRYQIKNKYASNISWSEVVDSILRLAEKVIDQECPIEN